MPAAKYADTFPVRCTNCGDDGTESLARLIDQKGFACVGCGTFNEIADNETLDSYRAMLNTARQLDTATVTPLDKLPKHGKH